MNIDFNFLKKSLNKRLKFQVIVFLENGEKFTDDFYGYIKEVNDNYIIVEHFYLQSDENFAQRKVSQKRKLIKNEFVIDKDTPINR